MKHNDGIPYEILVQSIFQEISNQDAVQTIEVQRNVRLRGKTGTHQVNVYWKFKLAEIIHQVIVQVKDYQSRVKREVVLTLKSVLEDVPGQPRGVIVTRTGFQSGASSFAKHHGIKLYLLKPHRRKYSIVDISYADYRIDPNFYWHVTVYRPEVTLRFLSTGASSKRKKLPRVFPRQFNKMTLLDSQAQPICTVADLLRGFIGGMRNSGTRSMTVEHRFTAATHIRLSAGSQLTGLTGIDAKIVLVAEPQPPVRLLPAGIVQFILEDLDEGTHRLFVRPHSSRLQ